MDAIRTWARRIRIGEAIAEKAMPSPIDGKETQEKLRRGPKLKPKQQSPQRKIG